MKRGGWSRSGGVRRHLRRIGRARREVARTITPGTAVAVRRAMGVTDGSGLNIAELAPEDIGRDHIRQMLKALADLHASEATRPPSRRTRGLRALLARRARCMALFSRRLTLSDRPATRRSAPGATAA